MGIGCNTQVTRRSEDDEDDDDDDEEEDSFQRIIRNDSQAM